MPTRSRLHCAEDVALVHTECGTGWVPNAVWALWGRETPLPPLGTGLRFPGTLELQHSRYSDRAIQYPASSFHRMARWVRSRSTVWTWRITEIGQCLCRKSNFSHLVCYITIKPSWLHVPPALRLPLCHCMRRNVTTLSLRLISHTVSCTLVDRYQHFGDTCCLHLHARKAKTMATDCYGRDTFHKTVSFVLIP
jgi:hypothetical protein